MNRLKSFAAHLMVIVTVIQAIQVVIDLVRKIWFHVSKRKRSPFGFAQVQQKRKKRSQFVRSPR